MNYAAHHNAHHSFLQLPLAIEIPDTFSKFHLQQECLWKYYIIVSDGVLWTSCTLQVLCACKWKGRKLKRISTFRQEKKTTQRKSNTAAHEHCYVRNFVKFTKHSSYFYDFPHCMSSPLLARFVCHSFHLSHPHDSLTHFCYAFFNLLLWAWLLFFPVVVVWNFFRAVCFSLPFFACFVFVWHRRCHTLYPNQLGGMRFCKNSSI